MRERVQVSMLETKSVHLDFPREVFIQCPTMEKKNHLTCWLSGKGTPLPMQEIWVRPLGREDHLEKETATHSSILAWEIPWTEEPGGLQSMGLQKELDTMTQQQHHLRRYWKAFDKLHCPSATQKSWQSKNRKEFPKLEEKTFTRNLQQTSQENSGSTPIGSGTKQRHSSPSPPPH